MGPDFGADGRSGAGLEKPHLQYPGAGAAGELDRARAGVAGLHARRHEAELRLKAAETNLTRVEDVIGQLSTQVDGLKKQARQASRYRNISDHIRKTEAGVLHRRWREARIQRIAPISTNLVLAYVAEHVLGMPRSY